MMTCVRSRASNFLFELKLVDVSYQPPEGRCRSQVRHHVSTKMYISYIPPSRLFQLVQSQ
jgi:hypothetical protein